MIMKGIYAYWLELEGNASKLPHLLYVELIGLMALALRRAFVFFIRTLPHAQLWDICMICALKLEN